VIRSEFVTCDHQLLTYQRATTWNWHQGNAFMHLAMLISEDAIAFVFCFSK